MLRPSRLRSAASRPAGIGGGAGRGPAPRRPAPPPAAAAGQLARRVLGRPHLDLEPRLAGLGQLELLCGPALYDLPRVAGRRRRVDEHHAGRALAGGLLELVAPAAVVEPRLAGEEVRI